MWLSDFLLIGKKSRPPTKSRIAAVAKNAVCTSSPLTASATQITYNPELIARFKEEHRKLLGIFERIDQSLQKEDLVSTVQHLDHFRVVLQNHLFSENIRLYVYLQQLLAHDPESAAMMQHFRREMDGIGKAIIAFLSKYRRLDQQTDLKSAFKNDLADIHAILKERIQQEEDTLYALYQPAD